MRYTCAIRAVATVGKLILIKSQRAIHWPAARSLSFSRSLPHCLSFSYSLNVQVLFAKSARIFVSVSERGPCRAYSQQRSRCQWAKDATADCRLLWAATTLQCPWMTLLLRPSRRRCHYNWRCCHGCHDERWQNKEQMEFNWNWNFSYIVSTACIVLSLVCSFMHHHEQIRQSDGAASFFIISTSCRVCIKKK